MPSNRQLLRSGVVIPAHPLALTARRTLDEPRQRALTRYYMDAGAGGIAVGVHTTQFAIRHSAYSLYRPVLELAAETAAAAGRPFGEWQRESERELLLHCREVGDAIPLFGFYLQPAVGGRVLSYAFWREFAEIPNVWAIKIAPFNRYQTIDVVRAIAESGRDDIALYTGNDDSIVVDLLTPRRGSARTVGMLDTSRGAASRAREGRARGSRHRHRVAARGGRPHGCKCRDLRRRACLSRLHPWHSRSAASSGAAGWHVVLRSHGDAVAGSGGGNRSSTSRVSRARG
jgi:hypothetical protein